MLYSGINVVSAFNIIKNQTKDKKTYRAFKSIVEDIESGISLYEATKRTKYFDESFYEMVRIGEHSGKIDIIFDKLSTYYYKEYKIKQAIKQGMTYPIFILFITIIASIIMMFTILPMIKDMVDNLSLKSLPLPTKVLLYLSSLKGEPVLIIIFIVLFILILTIFIKQREYIFHKFITKIPGISSVYKMIIAEKFARSLSLLWVSGIPIIDSLSLCESLLGNFHRVYLKNIKNLVESGNSLYSSIRASNIFPEFFSNMIETGEESGRLDSVLESIADFYEREIAFNIKKATKIFEPMLIIGLSLVVGFILAGVLLPVFQIYGQV